MYNIVTVAAKKTEGTAREVRRGGLLQRVCSFHDIYKADFKSIGGFD